MQTYMTVKNCFTRYDFPKKRSDSEHRVGSRGVHLPPTSTVWCR